MMCLKETLKGNDGIFSEVVLKSTFHLYILIDKKKSSLYLF